MTERIRKKTFKKEENDNFIPINKNDLINNNQPNGNNIHPTNVQNGSPIANGQLNGHSNGNGYSNVVQNHNQVNFQNPVNPQINSPNNNPSQIPNGNPMNNPINNQNGNEQFTPHNISNDTLDNNSNGFEDKIASDSINLSSFNNPEDYLKSLEQQNNIQIEPNLEVNTEFDDFNIEFDDFNPEIELPKLSEILESNNEEPDFSNFNTNSSISQENNSQTELINAKETFELNYNNGEIMNNNFEIKDDYEYNDTDLTDDETFNLIQNLNPDTSDLDLNNFSLDLPEPPKPEQMFEEDMTSEVTSNTQFSNLTESLLKENEESLEEKIPEEPPAMVAYEASLAMPMVHSVCSPELRPEYDEINPALAVFAQLQEGESAFIQFSLRPAPIETAGKMQEMLTAISLGMPLEEKRKGLKGLSKFIRWTFEWIAYSMSSSYSQAPVAPWKSEEAIKPPARHTITEKEKAWEEYAREKVQAGKYFEGRLYMGAIGSKEREQDLDRITQELQAQFNGSYSNSETDQGFVYKKTDHKKAALGLLTPYEDSSCVLTPPELGEMMKVPDSQTGSSSVKIEYGMRTQVPRDPIIVPDALNPPPGVIALGEINVDSNKHKVIGMPLKGLNTHLYMCGTTGSGKSTMLEWIIYGLAKNGKCLFLVDPHGTLVDNVVPIILAFAPERADDILILDFGDSEYPVSFNPIAIDSYSQIESTTNSVKEMILKMLHLNPEAAPRAVNYVEQAVWAMSECNINGLGGHKNLALSLLQVPDFFTNKEFRQLVMQFCTNLAIRSTFDPEGPFEKMGERQQLDHVMPVLRTFSSLATKDSFANIFGQSESKIDFAKWVQEKKIVLMKLPAIASDASVATFIGAMVTPMIIGSLSSWGHNPDLAAYLVIDEFQNYATESYKSLLAQTRKHGLHGISANQVPQDLPSDVLRGVQSNTQTKISMRLDPRAVKEVADFIASGEEHPNTADILALPNYFGWANIMMEGGKPSGPFSFKGLAPPLDPNNELFGERYEQGMENIEKFKPTVINNSRLSTALPRDEVWERRQNHLNQVTTVLEQKVSDKLKKGGFDDDFTHRSEEIMNDRSFF